jgi:LPS sulfotransferase NodH
MSNHIPEGVRPDLMDLAGAAYDMALPQPAEKTLIICSAPRSGSYELCRFLLAAGVGIPHEYFHPQFAKILGERWELPDNPLEAKYIDIYLQLLKHQRAQNGVFAVNMQHWQFTEHLMNKTGAKLFNGAKVIHLYRPDIVTQITSWRVAMNTGIWDFSARQTSDPREYPQTPEENAELFEEDIDFVVGEDAGFRKLFALLDIAPVFLTTNDLFRAPQEFVCEIARSMGVEPNIPALEQMIATSEPYRHDAALRRKAYSDLSNELKRRAFRI